MTDAIDNSQEVIDSRDVIERIDELKSELQDAHLAEGNKCSEFDAWLRSADQDDKHTLQDAAHELIILCNLADESNGCADWVHGETLIRDSYFVTYAQELADDIGAVSNDRSWPNSFIDWEAASDALKQDYSEVDFDGVAYWIRS